MAGARSSRERPREGAGVNRLRHSIRARRHSRVNGVLASDFEIKRAAVLPLGGPGRGQEEVGAFFASIAGDLGVARTAKHTCRNTRRDF